MTETAEKKKLTAGERLKKWMDRRGLTYEGAGVLLGCSHATVRRLVRNEVAPDVDQAARIESAARIRMNAWVGNKS